MDTSSQRRYSGDHDEFHHQDCDYLGLSSIRKRKSSSSPDYPSRRPTEERRSSRYHDAPSRSVKRRSYHDRYPSTPSPERRRRCDSRLLPERRSRRRRRYDCHASRVSVERRRHRYPSSRQTKGREKYVSLNHPYERRSGCDSISILKTREEMISRDISSNFCSGTPRKITSTSSNCLYDGSLSSLTDKQDDLATTWMGSFPGFVSEDLVIEILSRLPVESLMRFKSVCKRWCNLIKHDRRFIDLHHYNRIKSHPNLLFISGINPRRWQPIYTVEEEPVEDNVQQVDGEEELEEEDNGKQLVSVARSKVPQQILFADIVEGSSGNCEEIVPRAIMTDDNWFHYEHVLGLVNGLACFLDFDEDGVKLYNVSTREASPWIKTTLLSQEEVVFSVTVLFSGNNLVTSK